jgi:RHS repeat-associated protein
VDASNTPSWRKEYALRDHLGSTRLLFADKDGDGMVEVTSNASTNEIIQEQHYYPFGLSYGGSHWMNDAARDNGYKFNGKELNEDWGLGWYDYGARWYMPDLGRWGAIDPLSEMYHTASPYAFVQNNPLINREIDGRYFDDKKSAKQADKLERKSEKQANKLDKKADKIDEKGGNSGDLRDRTTELKQSAQDVRDMRNDQSAEYKYAKLDGKEGKALGLVGPSTTLTGQNGKGDNVVTMFTEKNMGNQIHETRHGGQNARGEFNVATGAGYGVADEVSAYRAQYSWDGYLKIIDVNKTPTQAEILNSLQTGSNPLMNTINAINQINANFVNSLVDPGFAPI